MANIGMFFSYKAPMTQFYTISFWNGMTVMNLRGRFFYKMVVALPHCLMNLTISFSFILEWQILYLNIIVRLNIIKGCSNKKQSFSNIIHHCLLNILGPFSPTELFCIQKLFCRWKRTGDIKQTMTYDIWKVLVLFEHPFASYFYQFCQISYVFFQLSFGTYLSFNLVINTPGTAGGPGGRDRTLAV